MEEITKFMKFKGIGGELAEMLLMNYKTFDNFKVLVTKKDLIDLYGIGAIRASKIMKEVEHERD